MYRLARPLLFRMEPERAHRITLGLTDRLHAIGGLRLLAGVPVAPLPTRVFGLDFPNPVGLAAGLDKNGEHVESLFALGFGFVEVGTVTPHPQPGNPQPRLFRLPEHNALINRMGFNNHGVGGLVRNLQRVRVRRGVLGVNIGKNRQTPIENAAEDYLHCLERVYPLADYVTVNISSPNTAALRELQEEDALRELLVVLTQAQRRLARTHRKRVPVLVKVAPDLNDAQIDTMARVFNDAQVDGVVATNTTLARDGVAQHPLAAESGGLSGAPLVEQATGVLRAFRQRLDAAIPLIGVGGITCGADAAQKIDAGAHLVQVYTGLIYRGPGLIGDCVQAIQDRAHAGSEPVPIAQQ